LKKAPGACRQHAALLQRDNACEIPLDQIHVVLDLNDGRTRRLRG